MSSSNNKQNWYQYMSNAQKEIYGYAKEGMIVDKQKIDNVLDTFVLVNKQMEAEGYDKVGYTAAIMRNEIAVNDVYIYIATNTLEISRSTVSNVFDIINNASSIEIMAGEGDEVVIYLHFKDVYIPEK